MNPPSSFLSVHTRERNTTIFELVLSLNEVFSGRSRTKKSEKTDWKGRKKLKWGESFFLFKIIRRSLKKIYIKKRRLRAVETRSTQQSIGGGNTEGRPVPPGPGLCVKRLFGAMHLLLLLLHRSVIISVGWSFSSILSLSNAVQTCRSQVSRHTS